MRTSASRPSVGCVWNDRNVDDAWPRAPLGASARCAVPCSCLCCVCDTSHRSTCGVSAQSQIEHGPLGRRAAQHVSCTTDSLCPE